jgi:hypothetical protein
MADIEALILETIEIMTPLISKPKMSDKYLRKPPFRYLHDIVVALVEAHQFPKRLTAPDLDHNNFTEKVRRVGRCCCCISRARTRACRVTSLLLCALAALTRDCCPPFAGRQDRLVGPRHC